MTTLTIRKPEDVDAIVRTALKFSPADSVVVIPIGGGAAPFARVDLDTPTVLREAFSSVLPYWQRTRGVVVAIYSDGSPAVDVACVLPGVNVLLTVQRPNPGADAFREADLVALTQHVDTSAEAVSKAWSAYEAGDGALAWRYIDRARQIGLTPSENASVRDLDYLMTEAIDPHAV